MSFKKVTPQKNAKQHENQTARYSIPMRTSLVVKSHYQNDINLALESEREIADASQNQRHLYMDGLCQNTIENLDNSAVDEEKIKARQRRVLSYSAVLMFVVCAVSLISLVLTLLMLTGNISPRCSCASSKGLDRSEPLPKTGFSLAGGKQEAGNGFQRWLIDVLRNMTEKMEDQSRDFHKLKNDFIMMNENKEKNENELQESVKETKNELDSKIRAMKAAMTHVDISLITLNTTSQDISKEICKLKQDLGETKKSILRLKMNSKIYKLQTKLNQTTAAFHLSIARQQEKLKEVSKTANYKLNLTKDEINSSLQEISSDLLEMKTYFTKQVNNTKRSIEASSSMLQNSIKDLNETLLNKIKNITKPSSSIGSNTSNYGSSSVPGINAANFSQCQYKILASPGIVKNGGAPVEVEVDVKEPKGKRIVGSTCSTNGAAEYNFKKLPITSINVYKCTCKGVSTSFTPAAGEKIHCYLHYWECPFVD